LACLRQAKGVVRLADTFGAECLDVARGRALVANGSLRTVRMILTKGRPIPGLRESNGLLESVRC
jgi:hypothetical protein